LKAYLSPHFHMNDLLRYSFRDRDACSPKDLSLTQIKYLTNLQKETVTLGSKAIDTPMDLNIHFD